MCCWLFITMQPQRQHLSLFSQIHNREIYGSTKIKIHQELIISKRRALNSLQPSSSDNDHRFDDVKMFLRAWIAIDNIESKLSEAGGLSSSSLYDALNYLAKRIADNAGNTNNPDYERNFVIYFEHLRSMGLVRLVSSLLCSGPLYCRNYFTGQNCRQYILNKIMSITTLRKIVGKQVGNIGESVGDSLSRDDQLLDYLFHCCAVPGMTLPSADLFEDLYILRRDCFVLPHPDELNQIVSCLGDLQLAIFTRILGISIRNLDKYQIKPNDNQSGQQFETIEIQKKNLDRIMQIPRLIPKLMIALKTLSIQAIPRYPNDLDENSTWYRYVDELLSTQLRNGYNPGPAGQMSEDLLTYTTLIHLPASDDAGNNVPPNLAFQPTLNSIVVLNTSLSLVNFLYLLVSGPRRKSVVRVLIGAGLLDNVLRPIFDRLLALGQRNSAQTDAASQMSSPESILKVHLFRLLQLVLHVAGTDTSVQPQIIKSAFSSEELDMLYDITSRLLVEEERDATIEHLHDSCSHQARTNYRKGFFKSIIDCFSSGTLPRWQKFWFCAILETYLRISSKPAAFQIFFSRCDVIKTTIKCFLTACGSDLFSTISAPNRTMPNAARESDVLLSIDTGHANDQRFASPEYASRPSLHETSLDLLAGLVKFNHRNIMRLAKDLPNLVSAHGSCSKNCSSNMGGRNIHSANLCETKWPFRLCTCSGSCNLRVPSGALFCFMRHICDNVVASSLLLRSLLVTQYSLPWQTTVPHSDDEISSNTALFMEAFGSHCLRSYVCYKLLISLDPKNLTQSETSALTTALTILVHSCKNGTLDRHINSFCEFIRRDSSNPAFKISESSFMNRLKSFCEHWSNRFLNSSRIDFSSLHSSTRLQIDDFVSMLHEVLTHPVIRRSNTAESDTSCDDQAAHCSSSVMNIIRNRLSSSSQESHRSNTGIEDDGNQSTLEDDDETADDDDDDDDDEEEDFGSSERLVILDYDT